VRHFDVDPEPPLEPAEPPVDPPLDPPEPPLDPPALAPLLPLPPLPLDAPEPAPSPLFAGVDGDDEPLLDACSPPFGFGDEE
jgi:hypothetical protein